MQPLENSDSDDEIWNDQQTGIDGRRLPDIRKVRNTRYDPNQRHYPGFVNKTHRDVSYRFNRSRRNTRNTMKLARKIRVRDRNSGRSSTTDDVAEGDSSTLSSWRRVDLTTSPRDVLFSPAGSLWARSEGDETLCQGGDSQEAINCVGRNRGRREAVPGIGELTLVLESAYPRQFANSRVDDTDWETRSSVSV